MSLLTFAFSFCCLTANVWGTCLRDVNCSGFVAPNTPIITLHDACTQPDDRPITPTPCGRDGIFHEHCRSAGCCYRDGQCYKPLVEDRVDYKFYGDARTYSGAYKACKSFGFYKIACVKDDYEYSRVRDKLCGSIWLSGAYSDRDNADMVPFYNTTSDQCSSQIGISCKLHSSKTMLSLVQVSEDAYFLSLVDRLDTRPFLCIKERWQPHISIYPAHVTSSSFTKQMTCGIIFSGDAIGDKLKATWQVIHPNGTDEFLKRANYTRTATRQQYRNIVRASRPGKYICTFIFRDHKRDRVERVAWAYHYTNVTCTVSLDGRNYTMEDRISYRAAYNSSVTVTTHCVGYPAPYLVPTARVNGGDPVRKPIVLNGANFVIDSFATEVSLGSDYSYELTLQPISLVETLVNKTITITKLPIPISCNLNFITDEEGSIEIAAQSVVERQVRVGEYFSAVLNCTGYPKPNITATKTTSNDVDEVTPEDLTNTIQETSAHWRFENFSSEASPTRDYRITLNISVVPSPDQEPINFTLVVSKESIPTTCTFTLNNETQDFNVFPVVINRKSFANNSFEVAVSCTGYPEPDITAVKYTIKGDGAELEEALHSSGATFNWAVNNFATEASPAQDYSLTLNISAASKDAPPIEMSLVIVKTVIMFDTDQLPRGVLTIDSTAGQSPDVDDEEGHTAQIVFKEITLPCGGVGAEPFPTPTAFWEYNSKRLDLSTSSELGQHIRYRNPEMSETDATILIKTQSSIVGGNYTCVISNGKLASYSTELRVTGLPPVPPGQAYITRVAGDSVRAASFLQPSYLNMDIRFTGYLYAAETILDQTNQTEVADNKVEGVFTVPPGSDKIRIGFKARNDYGDSEMSVMSEELEILPETPNFSVATIERDEDSNAPLHSSLSLTFTAIDDVDEYEVRLYSADGAQLRVINVKDNLIVIDDLRAETGYFIAVRGVKVVAGRRVYGPSSLTSGFMTAPAVLPAPTGLNGQPLESDGNTSAVLLTWDAPKVGGEFIEGYILAYGPTAQMEGEGSEGNRRKRQALQTVKTSFIPYGLKAAIVKELQSGTSYEFILKSYSSDFGESVPAKVTVQTLTKGPCPYTRQELYPPRHCQPRVSIDRQYLYIKFNLDCYDGTGLDYRGTYNNTLSGEQCAPWTTDNLKNFVTRDDKPTSLPSVGTNHCRNFNNSWKDATGQYDRPWCYLPDGRNQSCSIRPCHSDLDQECYTEQGMSYKGEDYSENCRLWTSEILEQYNVTEYDEEVLGRSACRNWKGSNMTRPWCVDSEGSQAECGVPPCGTGIVAVKLGDSPGSDYHISRDVDYVCVPLQDQDRVTVRVKHTFGVENCESDEIPVPEIKIPREVGVMDRLWVRYILIEVVLVLVVLVLWATLLYRKRLIWTQQRTRNGKTQLRTKNGTTLHTKKITSSSRINSSPPSRHGVI